jgi:tetratricopeptide (TPR) repeat protein
LEDKVNNNQPDIDAFDFFALGNAYFKQGLNGKAMAAYLKASELAPRSSVIAFNLKKVSDQSRDKLGYDWPEAQWKKALVLYRKLSVQELFYLGAMLIALAGIFICAYLFSSKYKRLFITLCFICFGFGGYAATVFFSARAFGQNGAQLPAFKLTFIHLLQQKAVSFFLN